MRNLTQKSSLRKSLSSLKRELERRVRRRVGNCQWRFRISLNQMIHMSHRMVLHLDKCQKRVGEVRLWYIPWIMIWKRNKYQHSKPRIVTKILPNLKIQCLRVLEQELRAPQLILSKNNKSDPRQLPTSVVAQMMISVSNKLYSTTLVIQILWVWYPVRHIQQDPHIKTTSISKPYQNILWPRALRLLLSILIQGES